MSDDNVYHLGEAANLVLVRMEHDLRTYVSTLNAKTEKDAQQQTLKDLQARIATIQSIAGTKPAR